MASETIIDTPLPLTPQQTLELELARQQVEAGLTVPAEAVDAWIDSWDTLDEVPMPVARVRAS